MRRPLTALLMIVLALSTAGGQTQSRIATTRTLLMQNPLFFHSRAIAITDTPDLRDGVWRLAVPAGKTLVVALHAAPSGNGPVEIRGTFIDVGRFAPDDSRITAYSLQPIIQAVIGPGGAWPARETLFAIVNATTLAPEDPTTVSMRAIAMAPDKFDGKPVTLRGRFRGRNLLGDLPNWPKQASSDFVLQAGDGSIWISGIKPKGKGFDLDGSARKDVGRWLEVSGSMSVADGLPILRAKTIAATSPEDEGVVTEPKPAVPILPPPVINFSVPTDSENDIATSTPVRVQFSRDMKAESFEGHVRVTAVAAGAGVPVPSYTTTYQPGTLSVQIKFADALPRFATITVEFLDGITTSDGTPLAPSKITFTTGSSSLFN